VTRKHQHGGGHRNVSWRENGRDHFFKTNRESGAEDVEKATKAWRGRLAWALITALVCSATPRAFADESATQPLSADWTQREFWQTTSGKPVPDGWQFADGVVSLVDPKRGGNIVTPPLPPDFELSWQWRIEKGVNSGLKYRVRRHGEDFYFNQYIGPEYQIIDSKPTDVSKGSTGAIYGLVGPVREKVLYPPGQWNQSRVVALGDHLEHYLNGTLVASAVTAGPGWEATVALSKFSGTVDFGGGPSMGRIMLTNHGGRVRYKAFRFVSRDRPVVDEPPRSGPFLANGSRNSWADQQSIVIWTRTTRAAEMRADGLPFVAVSTKEAAELSHLQDADRLLAEQLPQGARLDEMFGACPGAAGRVRLSYFPEGKHHQIKHADWKETVAESDFTAQWKLEGLAADTRYVTVIEAQTTEGEPTDVQRGGFRTPPRRRQAKPLAFCVTTCHDFIRRDDGLNGHKIYAAMSRLAPDFVVHAGDIEYYDKPDPWAFTKELMRFKWGRLFALPANRDFYSRTTSYFIKDDHDTLADDCWPGQTYGTVTFEEGVRLFNEEQFPSRNPRYANIRWGRDLEIWILEGRDYRSPNTAADGPEKTILGAEQKAWLFDTLQKSAAAFKLVFSPTPIVGPDRDKKHDNHANEVFAWEGRELRERLSAIPGVIVLCGDRHWQYASVDSETDLWEFGCGPGSEKHQLGWKPGDQRPSHRFLRVAGGFLSGELAYPAPDKPTLTICHRDVDGAEQSRFVFPQSDPDR
jgi:alkaline phosphatase D